MSDLIKFYISVRKSYLSGVPDLELSRRCFYLLNNISNLNEQGFVVPHGADANVKQRLYDVYAEIFMRGRSIESFIKDNPFENSKTAMINSNEHIVKKVKKLQSHIPRKSDNLLFRFNSFEFMEDFVLNGGVYLQSASAYKAAENISIRDDELCFSFTHYLSELDRKNVADVPYVDYEITCPDFLTLCFTSSINFRMIADWSSEAAVIGVFQGSCRLSC